MSIYNPAEYAKHVLIIGEPAKPDKRTATIAQIRELISTMSAKEKKGLKPATVEKLLKKIEEQINESI